MSIAKQQNALLDEAKQVFGKLLDAKVTAVDAASETFAAEISQAMKEVVQHIQNEYGYAISFYIAHDFQNHINADPNSPFKMDLSFEYTHGGANPLYN